MSPSRKCTFPGCKSTRGLHAFPKEPEMARRWLRHLGRDPGAKTSWLFLCNLHFARECFCNFSEVEMGFSPQLRLREDAVPTPAVELPKITREIGCQAEPIGLQHAYVQVHLKPPRRSKAVQARAPHRSVSCDTSTLVTPPEHPTATSTSNPMKRPRFESCNDDSSFRPEVTVNGTIDCESTLSETPPHNMRKYIVYEDNLMELFKKCPVCLRTCIISTKTRGPLLQVDQSCPHCEYGLRWNSQPYVNSIPAGNLQLSAAVLFTGSSFVQIRKEVPSEEGCSGITFDVSEITVASDDESNCSDKGHGDEEEDEEQDKGEKSSSDPLVPMECGREQQDADCSSLNGHQTVVAEIPSPAESLSVQNTKSKEVPSEEGCSGITFDVSEITFAADKESSCSDKGHDDEEEEEEEMEEEKPVSDPEWEQSESDKFEEDELSSDSELPVKIRQLCPDCGAFFNTGKSHTCEYKIKPYSCSVCGKRCVDESGLKAHSRIHKETYEHFCKFCLATFRTRLNKLSHEETHASDGRPYQCPDCSLTFSKIHERNLHLKDHRGPKMFSCPHCNLEFADIYSLERHVVVHTGVKPFVCEFCSRSFNQAGHLKSHMRLHTGEKPFQCQHCDKSFNHNVSLKSHVMRYHSGASDSESNRHIENVERSVAGEDQMRIKEESSGDVENMSDHTDQAREVSPLEKGPTKKVKTKSYRRSSGRPKGRPKRNAALGDMNLVPAVSGEAQDPSTAAETLKVGRLKRTRPKDIESNGSAGDSPLELSGEDEQEGTKEVRKSKVKACKRPKNFDYEDYDSDSDFDPLEEMRAGQGFKAWSAE